MAKSPSTKSAARKIFQDRLDDGGSLTVFSHDTPGVPDLGTMSEISKEIFMGEIHHMGFGLFVCKYSSLKKFYFDAGGSMTRVPAVEDSSVAFSWGNFSWGEDINDDEKRQVISWFIGLTDILIEGGSLSATPEETQENMKKDPTELSPDIHWFNAERNREANLKVIRGES